jgi:hypothetical protein
MGSLPDLKLKRIMKNEKQLQAAIVLAYRQRYAPKERGMLWATLNRTLSQRDGQTQKATGLVPGVADLLYFENEVFAGLEVKFPGNKHDAEHIKQQYDWGVEMEENGGFYFIITSVAAFWAIIETTDINFIHPDIYRLLDIKKLIDTGKKTLIF